MLPSKIGPITEYVNDFSGVMSLEKRSELNQLFQDIESKNLPVKQVITVIFPHREGKELLDIGVELFNHVGVGEKGLNNGLLLLISSEEKKLRIIVGKGLEFIYTETWCKDVIENQLRPLLNDGKYAELVEMLYKDINQDQKYTPENISNNNFPVQKYKYDFTKGSDSGIKITLFTFFGYPIFSFFLSLNFPYFAFYFFIFTFVVINIIFLFLVIFRKKLSIKGIGGVIFLAYFFMIIPGILAFTARQEQEYCKNNPQICEQRRNNDSYHSSYDSSDSSSRSSSSDFSGGGGSTNGAGWGD